MIEGRILDTASRRLVNVTSRIEKDAVSRVVKFDWLLVVYGNKLCCKHLEKPQEKLIRQQLRLAGRILLMIRKIDYNVTDFTSIYHVERYSSLVAAIRALSPEELEFDAPATASTAVTLIRHVGKYLCAEYIRLRNRESKTETEDFLTYYDSDICPSVGKLVADSQSKRRREKEQNIPTMEDIKKLTRYINNGRNTYFQKLSQQYSYEN